MARLHWGCPGGSCYLRRLRKARLARDPTGRIAARAAQGHKPALHWCARCCPTSTRRCRCTWARRRAVHLSAGIGRGRRELGRAIPSSACLPARVQAVGARLVLEDGAVVEQRRLADPLGEIERLHAAFTAGAAGPPEFSGGLVGYFGFEASLHRAAPGIRCQARPPGHAPDVLLMLSEGGGGFTNLRSRLLIIARRRRSLSLCARAAAPGRAHLPPAPRRHRAPDGVIRARWLRRDFVSSFTREEYGRWWKKARPTSAPAISSRWCPANACRDVPRPCALNFARLRTDLGATQIVGLPRSWCA